jgi:hypothetical protein
MSRAVIGSVVAVSVWVIAAQVARADSWSCYGTIYSNPVPFAASYSPMQSRVMAYSPIQPSGITYSQVPSSAIVYSPIQSKPATYTPIPSSGIFQGLCCPAPVYLAPAAPWQPGAEQANPRQTPEPPIDNKGIEKKTITSKKIQPPRVIDPQTDGKAGSPVGAKDVCAVGFWNITGRDISLTVNDKKHQLPKDQSLTLELEKHFRWSQDGGEFQQVRVPEHQLTHEIVVRDPR